MRRTILSIIARHSGARPTFLGELCARADALRDDLGLTGTRLGCEHGVCGFGTILLNGAPARSCLLLTVQCGGADIGIVEGLAAGTPEEPRLHPLQEAFT
jgi:aerobic carbon-monoxide dehydrogenase small subunit